MHYKTVYLLVLLCIEECLSRSIKKRGFLWLQSHWVYVAVNLPIIC